MESCDDQFTLQRFVDAQGPVFAKVCSELRAGCKQTHWMWFIFPQLAGLGSSEMAARFAIGSKEEAQAYLAHEILGPRLRRCTQLVNEISGRSVSQIFAYPDDLKFHSSMTLFNQAAPREQSFADALQKYFAGQPDKQTLLLLKGA
ncbi:MAG TPA: DUF1810 domain-containing protein [Candidatus Dormibacteraeota bacterium]|nr:DUF1810 domain-containing protein [Candidatus Dormibacteraeota bacterium]